jgi:hypothetical protein
MMTNGETQPQAEQPIPVQPAQAPPAEAPSVEGQPAPIQPAFQQPVPMQQPAAMPVQPQAPEMQAAPGGSVSMGAVAQWGAAGGALAGIIQAVLGIVNGFDIMGMLMTIVIGAVLGILSAVLLGQFGTKIPVQGTLMIKAALVMFLVSIVAGFVISGWLSGGFLALLLGIVGAGAGAFAFGWLIQKKIPTLI